jgi:hypothetical protein
MSQDEARRGIELTDLAINLEHAGDIIAKNLLVLAEEKSDKRLSFSREGWSELTALHDRVLANMQIAMNVLVSGDLEAARQLVVEKERMRKLERDSHERHLKRLQSGTVQSIETSDIHLEAVRALKEFNSLLVSVAYPILTRAATSWKAGWPRRPERICPCHPNIITQTYHWIRNNDFTYGSGDSKVSHRQSQDDGEETKMLSEHKLAAQATFPAPAPSLLRPPSLLRHWVNPIC